MTIELNDSNLVSSNFNDTDFVTVKVPLINSNICTIDPRIGSIDQARDEILEITTKLQLKCDPYSMMRSRLSPIIDYAPTKYLLYVNDGKLDYYYPRSPIGPYTHTDEVSSLIESMVNELKEFVEKLPISEKWIGLRLASDVWDGLNVIINDYGHSSSYASFDEKLSSIRKSLSDTILETKKTLNSYIETYTSSYPNFSAFELWELPAESYPVDSVESCIKRCYGPNLCQFVSDKILVKNDEGRIPKESLRDAIMAVATNVKRLDICWYLKEKRNVSAESPEYCDQVLQHFRKAKNGDSLLKYFGIPISHDKYEVNQDYIKMHPYLGAVNSFASCETSVLADMESSELWHSKQQVYMSEAEMYDQLNTLFQNPYEPQLFHTDKYLSFLTVASTSLAYVKSCNRNIDEIKHKIQPLVYLLESIVDQSKRMYPKKYVDRYVSEWKTLITQLKLSIQNPMVDYSAYYTSLFAYPGLNAGEKQKALASHRALQSSEFLARKVGYWNRYCLSNDEFVDTDGRLKDDTIIEAREGTLFQLSDGEKLVTYVVKAIDCYDGYVCQICVPIFVDANKPIPIKVIYQGTISNKRSEFRDTNPIGPGYGIWKDKGSELLAKLASIIGTARESIGESAVFDIEFCGHSLGASDAQNGAAEFSGMLSENEALRNSVNKIDVHTFNPAGIPTVSSDKFNYNMSKMKDYLGKIRHSMVKNDVVEKSAQNKLGANFPDTSHLEIMEISNLGVYHIVTNHCLYAHSQTDTILPHEVLNERDDADAIHRYLFGVTHCWTDLTNHAHDMINDSPILKVAFNSLYLVGIYFGINQIKKLESCIDKALNRPLIHKGITKIENIETSFLEKHVREGIKNIWDGFITEWRGTQILEGTG